MMAQSKKIALAALKMAMTESREEEANLKESYQRIGVKTAAVDYGGEYVSSIRKIVERAIVAAKREGAI